MAKFQGTLEDLKNILDDKGIQGQWGKCGVADQFRSDKGGIINLFANGTINFQGQKTDKDNLQSVILANNNGSDTFHGFEAMATKKAQVFVVYGHDVDTRDQLDLILRKLELTPFILAKNGGEGKTIIEALESKINPSQCRFGIVLLTPDDIGYSRKDGESNAKSRARQNVVLEMGMLIAALGRSNVAILKKGDLEVPSDADGIIYLPFKDHVKEIVTLLAKRLDDAGIKLSPKAILDASS